jgi:Collagen triple helix repeat (20 copies)
MVLTRNGVDRNNHRMPKKEKSHARSRGRRGPTGKAGPAGAVGHRGAVGNRGPRGEPGPAGPIGPWPLATFDLFFRDVQQVRDQLRELHGRMAALEDKLRKLHLLKGRRLF